MTTTLPKKPKKPPARHHLDRRAARRIHEMRFRPDVIERQLAHQEKNPVRAAYNRAEYLNERRTMMNQWADYIDAIGGRNVIPLQQRPAVSSQAELREAWRTTANPNERQTL